MTAADPTAIAPDRRSFERDAKQPCFLAGVARGSWKIINIHWPTVDLEVRAQDLPAHDALTLRCDFAGYPAQPPTATPGDPVAATPLAPAARPASGPAASVFRSDWNGGTALYAPYDRVALSTHADWQRRYPRYAWTPDRDVTWYVQRIWDLLNTLDDEAQSA